MKMKIVLLKVKRYDLSKYWTTVDNMRTFAKYKGEDYHGLNEDEQLQLVNLLEKVQNYVTEEMTAIQKKLEEAQ